MKSLIILITFTLIQSSVLSQSFTSNPEPGNWSNQPQITVSWSALTNDFSAISGYKYVFDQNVQTSTTQSSYPFTINPVASSSILGSGVYYFHLWTVSDIGAISPIVHTGAFFFPHSNAPNIPVIKNIPDIKLLKDSPPVAIFNQPDYVSTTSVSWSWSIETNWRHKCSCHCFLEGVLGIFLCAYQFVGGCHCEKYQR